MWRERLWPRWWVWCVLISLVSLLAWAYGLALGSHIGWTVFALGCALTVLLVRFTAPTIEITRDSLRVGKAELPRRAIAEIQIQTRDDIHALRGPGSDARLFVELRPWSASQAVLIRVCDPADPHPAWLVSSRHPESFSAALGATMDH